jgi:hypothetical protein
VPLEAGDFAEQDLLDLREELAGAKPHFQLLGGGRPAQPPWQPARRYPQHLLGVLAVEKVLAELLNDAIAVSFLSEKSSGDETPAPSSQISALRHLGILRQCSTSASIVA